MAINTQDTKGLIIHSALAILREKGMEGLTMRKVSDASGKSLGNVQHHFVNKEALLRGMALHYFSQCGDLIEAYKTQHSNLLTKQDITNFVLFCLGHADHLSDACFIFRELWAIAARDKVVNDLLQQYYLSVIQKTASLFEHYPPSAANRAISLLMPYLDGYSIQHSALPIDQKEVAELLSESIFRVLNSDS